MRRLAIIATVAAGALLAGYAVAGADEVVPTPAGFVGFCALNISMCWKNDPEPAPLSMRDTIIARNRQVNESLYDAKDYPARQHVSLVAPKGLADCEDYAVTKRFLLLWDGIPAGSMRLAVVRRLRSEEQHAVLLIKIGAATFILDSRNNLVLPLEASGYQWIAVERPGDPWTWSKP